MGSSIPFRRKTDPIPALLIQSLPGYARHQLFDELQASLPFLEIHKIGFSAELNQLLLEDDLCTQCDLTDLLIDQIEKALIELKENQKNTLLWIELPHELEVTHFAHTLQEIVGLQVHSIITCLDLDRFLWDFASDRSFQERFNQLHEPPKWISRPALKQPVLESLIHQIETCDFLYFSTNKDLSLALHILRTIQPCIPWVHHGSELIEILRQKQPVFDPRVTFEQCAWQLALQSSATPNLKCFRSRRPFHPARFNSLIEIWPESIIRSSGTLWIASHRELMLTLNQVGPSSFFLTPEGPWDLNFDAPINEIAFVSDEPIPPEWEHRLEECLLSELEMRMDWSQFDDPLPSLDEPEDDDPTSPQGPIKKRLLKLIESPESI